MKLIDNWNKILTKSYSTISNYIASISLAVYFFIPNLQALPPEIRDNIPTEYLPYVSAFFLFCAIAGRVVEQPKLHSTTSIKEDNIQENKEE